MKLDEFAFLNQQLAGMLKAGLPLETALRQVCAGMRRQRWRTEFERLQADLSQGVPLEKALDARKLPRLYQQMVKVGAKAFQEEQTFSQIVSTGLVLANGLLVALVVVGVFNILISITDKVSLW